MKILVVGGGGREHAIIKKLKENKNITEIFALPGNAGMAKDATLVNIGAKDIDKIVEFACTNGVDYAVVAPDDPLVLGCVDALEAKGIPCFGPRANAAIIEGMKGAANNISAEGYTLRDLPYEVAIKTGSPEKNKTTFHSAVVGFAPVDDPDIAIGIMLEESQNASWLVRKILDAYYATDGR